MNSSVREQMNRYPIFKCKRHQKSSGNLISSQANLGDGSQEFQDHEIKNKYTRSLLNNQNNSFGESVNNPQAKNQSIANIYDRILTNNAYDPLYLQAHKQKEEETQREKAKLASTARNSRIQNQRSSFQYNKKLETKRNRTVSKFIGELTHSMSQEQPASTSSDVHRTQKISLLKRIIEHYNLKTIQRRYYSSLIKDFGLKVQTVNSNEIAIKKNIHPREVNSKNNHRSREVTQPISNTENSPEIKNERKEDSLLGTNGIRGTSMGKDRKLMLRKIKQFNSLVLINQSSLSEQERLVISSKAQFIELESQQIKAMGNRAKEQVSQKLRRHLDTSQKMIQKPIKFQISTSVQDKLNKYKEFLFLLNMSNSMYINLDIEKYDKNYKFYVGRGNNRNMIKSLMKKRFWFQEVSDPKEAHFVWTQLKIENVFCRQVSGLKQQSSIEQIEEFPDNAKFDQEIEENIKKQTRQKSRIPQNQTSAKSKYQKYTKGKSKAKDYEPHDPLLKIMINQDLNVFKQINESLHYRKFHTFADKLKVCRKKLDKLAYETQQQGSQSDNLIQKCTQLHNHLQFNGLIGNKKALYYNIREYCKLTGNKISDYVPLTFHIKNGLADPDYKSLASSFAERKKQKYPNYWVMKPGQFSNRGQGIMCTNKIEDVRKRVSKCREQSKQKKCSLIVQLYISNPLLYYGRKFDIRVFMMMTISNGKIKGYWYQEGYVRTSSFLWNINDIEDKYIHLTNDAIQKTCEQYGKYEPGNKLTFTDLQRYIYTLNNNRSGDNVQFFDLIYPKMRSIAADVMKCSFLNIDPKRLINNFEVFGLDFMVDSNYKPWLIQVNTNPCLELSCPILERIIPHMVENAFRIALDPLFPPPSVINTEYKYSIPENALYYNKFELVFDEDRDGQEVRKLYKNSNIMEQIDDMEEDQEEFQADGEILQINDNQ